ncbi:MAG: hypothetical protein ACK5M3_03845 [Dysgonomonas sp.]
MIKIMYVLIFTFIGCLSTYATVQMSDKLIYNGREYRLDNFYLESFFEKYPDKRPESRTTALWRGYVATFKIEDGHLFITNIEVEAENENRRLAMKSIFSEIFPDSKKVKVEWFSGIFFGGYDDKPRRYFYEYDNYCLFEIKKGDIIKSKEFKEKEYKRFKKQQAKAFEKTEEYQVCIKDLKASHSKRMREMKVYQQNLLDTLKVRLSQNELSNQNADIVQNNTLDNEELKKYAKELENSVKSYDSVKDLSDKEAKGIIYSRIFSLIPQFIE